MAPTKQKEKIDRASSLPDHILHHILSFLDTKSMVQTGLLSRRWRFLWRDVGVLNFDRCSFETAEGFTEHVRKLLSSLVLLPSSSQHHDVNSNSSNSTAAVSDISFDFGTVPGLAAPDPDQRYGLRRDNIVVTAQDVGYPIIKVIETAASSMEHGNSLKTLRLKAALLIIRSAATMLPSGFKFVTNLELRDCRFDFPNNDDPFVDLPCLSYLKLHDCSTTQYPAGMLKVSGLQLLDLEMRIEDYSFEGIQVSAPELKSFRFQGAVMQRVELNRPSLDRANIRLSWEVLRDRRSECMNLLRGLHNATSLDLRFDKVLETMHWQPCHFPLTAMMCLMKQEGSPFTRLKRLRVQYPQKPPNIPRYVLRYFFGGSPKEKSVEFIGVA